jgi:hypothetical protein
MNYILGRPDDDDKKKQGGGTTSTTTTGAQTGVTTLTQGQVDAADKAMGDVSEMQSDVRPGYTGYDTYTQNNEGVVPRGVGKKLQGIEPSSRNFDGTSVTSQVGATPYSTRGLVSDAPKITTPSAQQIRDDVDKATQMKNYREVLDYLQGGVESKQDREKREKREARERKFAALSDALGAMHRAYTHSRGIEAMKLPQNAYEETLRRQQMLKQHRDQNAQAYATAYERMQQGKRAEEAAKLDKEYKERKLEFDRMNAESLRDYRLNQALNNDRRTSGYVSDKENQSKNRDYDTKSKDNLRRNQASNNNARTANQRAHNQVTEAQGWARLDQSNPENWETTSNSVQGFDMQTGGKTTTTKTTKSRKGSGGGGKNPNPMGGGGSKQNGGKGRKRNPMG